MHEDEDSKLIALLVKDYLTHYKMDYTLSVYLPEISLTNEKTTKEQLARTAGINNAEDDQPLLVSLLKGFRSAPQGRPQSSSKKAASPEKISSKAEQKQNPFQAKSEDKGAGKKE